MTPIGFCLKKSHKKNKTIKIVFRCDASQAMGAGHVMRCLTLANYLQSQGTQCVFSTIEETQQVVPSLTEGGYEVISPAEFENSNPDFVIIDHYSLTDEFFQNLKNMRVPVMIIDDLNEGEFYPCDILLVNNLAYRADDYKDLVTEECKIFAGKDFILLHPNFLDFDIVKHPRKIPADTLFLFFGGTDPEHLTLRLLRIIQTYKININHIDVVIGALNQDREEIKALCQALNANLHIQVDNIADIMKNTDLAVGCGGTAIWERLSLNVPTLEVSHSEWQVKTLQNLDREQYIKYLGAAGSLSDSVIADGLTKALENGLDLRYCPCGRGVDNLAKEIIKCARAA